MANVKVKHFQNTHSNTASFSTKMFFIKLATFFISNTGDIYTELSRVSESLVKIKVRSTWTLFVILPTLQVNWTFYTLHYLSIGSPMMYFKSKCCKTFP